MNNICVYGDEVEEIELSTGIQQPTLIDMMTELNRLRLENECLKADKEELIRDRDKWRNDYVILHNKIINEEKIEFEDGRLVNNNEGGWTEEEFDIAAQGYAEIERDYKIV